MALLSDVLTLSSQVIHGSVGNRATQSVFAHFGHRVWSLPTVLLPWHPGHGKGHKMAIPPEDFEALIDDLIASPKLSAIDGIMTGYLGNAAQAIAIARLVQHIKAIKPKAVYLCDPVMGDGDRLYVPEPVAQAIADHLLPLADIITPNRFELEWLSGQKVTDIKAAIKAAQSLAVPITIQTSVQLDEASKGSTQTGLLWIAKAQTLLASHKAFAHAPNGLGDMLGALVLSHQLQGFAPEEILSRAAERVFAFAAFCADEKLDMLPLNHPDLWRANHAAAITLHAL